MPPETAELLTPRILVVDDERQIHASLRLRLGQNHDLVFCYGAREALEKVAHERFDLCIADIHMPQMDGLAFIEKAQAIDPALGYIVLSAFDTPDNLRRAIPLQVYEFLDKPLPEKKGFEHRMPEWIERTRRRRREQILAQQAGTIERELDAARLERDVEVVASESARDALLQAAGLLTTIHAHLVTAVQSLAARPRGDPGAAQLLRGLEEARKIADAAVAVAAGFFDSAYAHRDSSPALADSGVRQAASIARKITQADETAKAVDVDGFDDRLPLRGLSGIQFLLMMAPAIGAALTATPANSTVRVRGEPLARLENVMRDPRLKNFLWGNRRHALLSQPGLLITIVAAAPATARAEAEAWLKGEANPFPRVTARGLVAGVRHCNGLFALAVTPGAEQFTLALALPV